MKKIYFLLMLTLAVTAAWSQTTRRWVGANNGSWTDANNWLTPADVTGVPVTNDIVVFSEGNQRTILNVPSITLNGLIVETGNDIILQNTGNDRTITISNGAGAIDFDIQAGSTLTLADGSGGDGVSITLRNNFDVVASIAGTLIINNGRTYDTDNNDVSTTVSGIIENRSNVNSNAAQLSFLAGGKYVHLQNAGNIPTASWNNASTCEVTGVTTDRPGNLTQEFGNFTWNCPNQTQEESFAGSLTNIDGDFTIISTGTGSIVMKISGGGTTTTNVDGDYIQSGGTVTILRDSDGYIFNVLGDFNMSGGTLRRQGGTANFNFAGNTVQTFTKSAGTISGTLNFTINNGATVNFGTSILNGSSGTFTLSAGGKITTANANGLGATGSIQVTGAKSYNSGADYEFQGASTGTFTTSTNPQVRNFTVRNTTTSNVVLAQPMTVNGVLELANGYLTTTATNLLTVNNAGSSTTANGAFVNGPLAKVITSITTFPFHVGAVSGGLRTISATSVNPGGATSTTFTARFFDSNPRTAYLDAALASGIERLSACEYWTLDRSTGGTKYNAAVTLSWSPASNCGPGNYINDPTTLRVLRHNGGTPGTWTNAGYASSTSSTVTSNTVSTFSPFAIGTTDASANPLPVVFGDVRAYEKNNGVQIEWSNLTEKDVAEYSIERSSNGRDFSAIAKQLPTSNQDDKASYIAFDAIPNAGANYYRIKAEETTGKIVYSKVLSVNLGKADAGLRLYPNPVSGNQVTINLSNMKNGKYNLRVINTAGQDIFRQVINNHSTNMTQTLDLPSTIKPGVYNLVVTGDNYRATKTFIVQ